MWIGGGGEDITELDSGLNLPALWARSRWSKEIGDKPELKASAALDGLFRCKS